VSKKKQDSLPDQPQVMQDGLPGGLSGDNGKAPPLTPRQRFVKHAGRRVQALLRKLKQVGNLSARSSYEFTDQERDEMLGLIDDAYKAMRQRFFPTPGAVLGARALFSWEKAQEPAADESSK
jgi:hypothetical protein